MEYVTLIEGILSEILPLVDNIAPAGIQNIINILEKAIPFAVQAGTDLIAPIQNIIAAIQGTGNVTADQITQLQAQSAALDAALDAAAKDDGLS